MGRRRGDADLRLEAIAPGRHALRGDLSVETARMFWEQGHRLLGGTGLVLDLAGVERADSAGLAALVALTREARAGGIRLSFVNIPAQLRNLASVSGVEALLPLEAAGRETSPEGHHQTESSP
ncbi:MAG: STAS domain-containing protein [Ectothiorhodospiraceae bacterium]|nr:STAS domain-containing protein [Ectothiorhodospiraceae bacterium]